MAEGLFYHQALRALTAQGVRFVVVGGVAVNLQGVPRFTADLDIAIAMDGDNLQAAARALLGMGLASRLPVRSRSSMGPRQCIQGISRSGWPPLTY